MFYFGIGYVSGYSSSSVRNSYFQIMRALLTANHRSIEVKTVKKTTNGDEDLGERQKEGE